MATIRFPSAARSLATLGSRRRAVVGALAGSFGFLGLPRPERVEAHNALKKCKKKSGKQKKKCRKKAKKHNATHGGSAPPPPIACGAGLTLCGNQCVNTQNDPQQCGKCDVRCPGSDADRCAAGTCTQAFESDGSPSNYTAPGTGMVTIEALGAGGGRGGFGGGTVFAPGGRGGKVTGSFVVTEGEVFQITVGQRGRPGGDATGASPGAGGDGGSGDGGGGNGAAGAAATDPNFGGGGGGGGGGTSHVQRGGATPGPIIMQAGGGGGGGGSGGSGFGGGKGGEGGLGGGVSDTGLTPSGDNGVSGPEGSAGSLGGASGAGGYGFGPENAVFVFAGGSLGDGRVTVTFTAD